MRVKITNKRMREIIAEEVQLAENIMPGHAPVNVTSPHEPEDREHEHLEDQQDQSIIDQLKEMWLNWGDDEHPYYHDLKEFIEQYQPLDHEGQECEEAHPYETHDSWVDASMTGKREMEGE